MVEIKTGVGVVDNNEPAVVKVINEAKAQGWELFPADQLKKNAKEWKASIDKEISNYPQEWLVAAKEATEFFPLAHKIHSGFLVSALKQRYISSLARRGGEGRTAGYEQALGLGDYVFLSTAATWKGADGLAIYFSPRPILEQPGTIVTMRDIVHLVHIDFDKRIKLYQRMAFTGTDFLELLPLFLVVHYGDVRDPHDSYPVSGYPQWFIDETGVANDVFRPEIKVKDKLELSSDCRIELTEEVLNRMPAEADYHYPQWFIDETGVAKGVIRPESIVTVEDKNWVKTVYGDRFVGDVVSEIRKRERQKEGPWVKAFVEKGREWWGEF